MLTAPLFQGKIPLGLFKSPRGIFPTVFTAQRLRQRLQGVAADRGDAPAVRFDRPPAKTRIHFNRIFLNLKITRMTNKIQ